MSEERLKEIRERAEKAVPGPWMPCERGPENPVIVCRKPFMLGAELEDLLMMYWFAHKTEDIGRADELTYDTTEFIAHAREDIPYLLDSLAQTQEENKRLRAEVIEECAKVCDLLVKECEEKTGFQNIQSEGLRSAAKDAWLQYSIGAEECAERIRQLKPEPSKDVGRG